MFWQHRHNVRLMLTATAILSILFFQNCSNKNFLGEVGDASTLNNLEDPNNPSPTPIVNPTPSPTPTPPTVTVVLKTLQPTLAVRGISCLMCHADIRSNVITDFGFGNTWYMGGAGTSWDGTQTWYNNLASTWQSAKQIKGSVFVPDQMVTADALKILGANAQPMKLVEFMNTPYTPAWNFDNDLSPKPMSFKIQPEAGKEKVIAKKTITIRAPYEYEIEGLAQDLFSSADVVGAKRLDSNASLQLVSKGTYMMNDESAPLECADGDIVVKGPLYLRALRVDASRGCRLYVTGSVFIEDAITYVGNGEKQNLQITSANGIFMGISATRLAARNADTRALQLAGLRSSTSRLAQSKKEADAIGVLKDAQDSYSPRASINYSGLLLNAPIVQSRYLGNVKGTIIAEAALFALGEFHFEFDPVFGEVNVFPKLNTPIIIVE